mmetsp:Transcript_9244/g.8683  ORF Transcript_9244/g.8683 Transcript_9244/m.8683 type:complete len:220 (+) Transcript_9244:1155-1814(+)
MFFHSDEGNQLDSFQVGGPLLYQLNVLLHLVLVGDSGLFEGSAVLGLVELVQGGVDFEGPGHLGAGDEDLPRGVLDQLREVPNALLLGAHLVRVELEEDLLQRLPHVLQQLVQPVLDLRVQNDALDLDLLLVRRDQRRYLVVHLLPSYRLRPMQQRHSLKHLFDVLVDGVEFFGLADELEKVVVGEEVEPGEGRPFCLQVVFQLLLDILQALIGILELG